MQNDLEDLVQELRTELAQQQKLTGYLESQVQPQTKQSHKTKSVSYHTTLVENGFFPDTVRFCHRSFAVLSHRLQSEIVAEEIRQCEKLEEQRDRLRTDLERQRRGETKWRDQA